jgi:hypothetical protein
MATATREEILRLFPGLPEHAVLALIDANATVAELDAAMLSLQGDDDAIIEFRRRDGTRLERLLAILSEAGIEPEEPIER